MTLGTNSEHITLGSCSPLSKRERFVRDFTEGNSLFERVTQEVVFADLVSHFSLNPLSDHSTMSPFLCH